MSTLEPLPSPDQGDVKTPVQRHLISAGAVVLAAGLLFAVVGAFVDNGPGTPQVVAQPSEQASASPTTTEALPSPTGTTSESMPPTPTPTPTPVTPTPTPTPEPTPTPTPEPTPDPTPTTDDGRISPSTISVQVLDAVHSDGRQAANDVAAELRADGYRVVATNQASRVYEKTTVMYTDGYEAQARQIAAEYGFTEVQRKPDNLVDTVQVHLVVGLDAS